MKAKASNGRFGPGLPRVGWPPFLLHLSQRCARRRMGQSFRHRAQWLAAVGGAGSGESEILLYLLENELVEAIIGLPTDMFYNTGMSTYVWIVSNRKLALRKGKVQLIDASSFWQRMRKSLGSKRKEMSEGHIADVTKLFGSFVEAQIATVFDADGREIARQKVQAGDSRWSFRRAAGWKSRCPHFCNDLGLPHQHGAERQLRDEKGAIVLGTAWRKANGSPTPHCAIPRTCRCRKTPKPTSSEVAPCARCVDRSREDEDR
jgi:type I restriction enzyme M protein